MLLQGKDKRKGRLILFFFFVNVIQSSRIIHLQTQNYVVVFFIILPTIYKRITANRAGGSGGWGNTAYTDICVFCTCIYVNIPSPRPSGESERCSALQPNKLLQNDAHKLAKVNVFAVLFFGFTSFCSPVRVCVCACDRTLTTVRAKAEY